MSKSKLKETRQYLIVQRLKQVKRATRKEIKDYLEREFEKLGYELSMEDRTFERDVNEIEEFHGYSIKCDKSTNSYYIEYEDENRTESSERYFEALNVYNALNINESNKEYLYLDKRQAQGTEHLLGLLHAIKKCLQISVVYQSFKYNEPVEQTLHPLALKEFKYRWYLFAYDPSDKFVKAYGLDRIVDFDITKKKFPKNTEFDVKEWLKHAFGIIVPSPTTKPQKIVLSFKPFDGKYIKSVKWHESQQILVDDDKELRISLYVYPTHDFKMELLSQGERVKVIEPKSLAKEMKEIYLKAAEQYK